MALTDRQIQGLKPRASRYLVSDGRGLSLDILPSAVMTWTYRYRYNGKQLKVTLGRYSDLSLKAARAMRDDLAAQVAQGKSPAEERKLARGGNPAYPTVREFGERYFREQVEKNWKDPSSIRRYLDNEIYPAFGDKLLKDITALDVQAIVYRKRDNGRVAAAMQLRGVMKQMFDYALEVQRVTMNPAAIVATRYIGKARKRSRVLTHQEIRLYLPYRDPETLKSFLKIIDDFTYDHSERLGDAFEYLLSVLGSQGDAGQFRTPRHIIDFIVDIVDPKKNETILDPACGTAGFLISAYKHIIRANSDDQGRSKLTPDEKGRLAKNIRGYDISPDMVRLSLVNLYLHGFTDPHIDEYDTLTSEDKWNETADVILANPPFMSPKGGIKPHRRFSVQSKRSEVLFVDYIAEHLSPTGRAGIIVPEGIIFQSQGAYTELRKVLVDKYLAAVISLPAGVFNPYSGVKTCVLILDKSLARKSDSIGFFKVENDGFGLGAQRRGIDKNDLPQVKTEVEKYLDGLRRDQATAESQPVHGLIVPKAKIAANGDYNLSGERYREGRTSAVAYPTVPIGEICELFNGRAFRPEDWQTENSGGLPIVRIQNLNDPTSSFNYFTGEVAERNVISKGELLFSWSGSRGTSFGAHIWKGEKAVLNQHIFKVGFDESRVTKMFLLFALNKAVAEIEENLHGGVGLVHITKENLERIGIPLPPLEVQKEIVAEIEVYQKVIDGARAVLDNYRPHIPLRPDWPTTLLGQVCTSISTGPFGTSLHQSDYIADGMRASSVPT